MKGEGHDRECYSYMAICEMFYHLLDAPDVLIAHESFFRDLFHGFDVLLNKKINNSKDYIDEFDNFTLYLDEMQQYYYAELAIPSKYYNEEVLDEIIGYLVDI